ncbi:uncharacterized protein BDV14DRAFT_206058 [Aspergillus stella-maris]|uniref:uncharacterized protein n=1 Tax=Aspergillus stella-maris TaxID=1810926 RepID=UPI003CCD1A96
MKTSFAVASLLAAVATAAPLNAGLANDGLSLRRDADPGLDISIKRDAEPALENVKRDADPGLDISIKRDAESDTS